MRETPLCCIGLVGCKDGCVLRNPQDWGMNRRRGVPSLLFSF